MRVKFHQNLDDLKEKLLVMAGMAEQAIQRSIEAYRTRDLSICELVFRAEPSINRLEREIDQMALDLLAMEQPMAIVILGGLFTSTLLNMLVLPALYLKFGRPASKGV